MKPKSATDHAREAVLPAAISALLVLPLLILELINDPGSPGRFPFMLFVFLWALPIAFMVLLKSTITSHLTADKIACGIVLLAIAGWWIGLVVDQMPCFLGVPNCD